MQRIVFFLVYVFLIINLPLFGQQNYSNPKIIDVNGDQDATINCGYPLNGNCLDLKVVEYPTLYRTTSYSVSKESYAPVVPFNSGTPMNADTDDDFLSKIKIPFSFCYFGINYNEVVIGPNGVVTFDLSRVGNMNRPNVGNVNPSIGLPKNTIFGVYNDLFFSKNDDSEIYYSVVGTAPFRKFVVNFYRGRILGCDAQSSTSQIVLSEGSNTIEVFVENKPIPCSDTKHAKSLLGIINSDGTVGYSPPDRNTGIWAATKEAWKFTPAGTEVVPQFAWFNSAKEIVGKGESISVCPKKNEIYTVQVSYPVCANTPVILEDSFAVTFAPDYPIAVDVTDVLCSGNSIDINLDDYKSQVTPQVVSNFSITFHLSQEDAESGDNPQPENFTLTNNRVFYVRIQNINDSSCYQTSVLNLSLLSRSLLTDKIDLCDINNDNIEKDYTLSNLNAKLFTQPLDGTLHYYLSEADATNSANEVTNIDVINGLQLFVKYKTKSCSAVFGPISINFLSSPAVNDNINFSFTTCDFGRDYAETFNFHLNLRDLVTSNPNAILSFYGSYQEAYLGEGIPLKAITEGKYEIFVRVQIPGEVCFSIATVNMDITFTKVEAVNESKAICYTGTPLVVPVDLELYAKSLMLKQSPIGISFTYFDKLEDAQSNTKQIGSNQNVPITGSFVSKVFYIRFTDATGCYALKTLEITLTKVVINTKIELCDFDGNGEELITLSDLDQKIVGSQNATVTYYLNLSDAQNGGTPITNFNVVGSAKLAVIVHSSCANQIKEITITLGATPVIVTNLTPNIGTICDNNNDGSEPINLRRFESQIYSGSEAYTFTYYKNYDISTHSFSGNISNPATYLVSGNTTVYVKVSNSAGCYSASTLNLIINFLPTIVLETEAILKKCDFEQDSNELFVLSDALPQLFNSDQNSYLLNQLNVTYYNSKVDAENGLQSKQIAPTFVTSTSGTVTLWARFTSNTEFCYSVAPIKLVTAFPPKARMSIITVCDDNLDGLFEVDLTTYTPYMIFNPNKVKDYTFNFFFTKVEAQNLNSVPIKNPSTFTFPETTSRIWVRVENAPGCFDIVSVDFKFGPKVKINSGQTVNICDVGNDGTEEVNLTQVEASIYSNQAIFEYFLSLADLQNNIKIATPGTYLFKDNSGVKKIYVKVTAKDYCPEFTTIELSLKKTPMFTVDDHYFCLEEPANIQPNFSGLNIVSYEWIDPSGKIVSTTDKLLDVKTEGIYIINVTSSNGCTFSTEFKVIPYIVPVITSVVLNGKIFTVTATGDKQILYSSDGINFQHSNTFNADTLPFGVTRFYVKFAGSNCLGAPKNGLKLHNAFSPNDDGVNDTWIINELDLFNGESINLKVYNRFQEKIYEQESTSRLEWDGKTLSRVVATDSYWYVLTLPDGTVYTGWVLLKNRN